MKKSKYIHREIEEVLRRNINHFPAIAVTGPRQSGKSTLLKETFGDRYTLVTFDDPLTRDMALKDPKLLIENSGRNIIFDEIQYVPEFLKYIKIEIDNARNDYGRFIITGSQQFHLIKNIGDTLAGRIALFSLLPFSMNEKSEIPHLNNKLKNNTEQFVHSSLRGSYPELSVNQAIDAYTWFGSYLQTYLERDIRSIYNIGDLRNFQNFMRLLASRCSQIINYSTIAGDLGITVNTVKSWLSILEASQIIYIMPPYYRNLGKRITKSPKIYFLETALVSYLTGISAKEHLLNGPMAGQLYENYVIQETIKFYYNRGKRPNLFYLRTHNNMEIDLIIEENMKIHPFEIKLTKTPSITMASQIERFKKTFIKLNILNGNIISLSDEDHELTKNVSAISLNTFMKNLQGIA